jgi:flagella basal body P-ring formation protein FlgA
MGNIMSNKYKARGLLLTAMMLCLAAPAFAASPKAESVITHDRITLGDVFDVKDNADYYLAPAPGVGKTTTLNANDLTRISDAFHLGWTPADGPQQVVIRRAASEIDHFDVQAALQEKLGTVLKGKKFDMELSNRAASLTIPATGDRTLKVDNFSYDAIQGTFSAVVSAAAAPETKNEISGKFYLISSLPVLKGQAQPGDIISAADIDHIDIRTRDITPAMVTDAAKLAGQTPRHSLSPMKPVLASDLKPPVIIKKGDIVTMVLKSRAINLTAKGRALENGSAGDAIHVMNTTSKQVLDATVTGAEMVDITPPMNAL